MLLLFLAKLYVPFLHRAVAPTGHFTVVTFLVPESLHGCSDEVDLLKPKELLAQGAVAFEAIGTAKPETRTRSAKTLAKTRLMRH